MYAALFGTPTGAPSRSDNFYAAPRAPTADSTELDLEAHSCELDWSPAAGGGAATDGAAKSPGVVVVAGAATKSEAMSRPTPDGHRAATTSDQRYERARRPVHTDDSAWRAADGYAATTGHTSSLSYLFGENKQASRKKIEVWSGGMLVEVIEEETPVASTEERPVASTEEPVASQEERHVASSEGSAFDLGALYRSASQALGLSAEDDAGPSERSAEPEAAVAAAPDVAERKSAAAPDSEPATAVAPAATSVGSEQPRSGSGLDVEAESTSERKADDARDDDTAAGSSRSAASRPCCVVA
mmetsp:Transcript_25561/g.76745  ORF Transcript_25561/g.76745 Transcript_25561/m.76745 type:complete len:301 (+) Transcript_25561:414-1316(+)